MNRHDLYAHLRYLQTEFKDEIPLAIIHSDSADNKFKARKGWWIGLLADLELGLILNYMPCELSVEIHEFVDKYRTSDFGKPEVLTTAEDIRAANELLDSILLSISTR